MPIGVIVSRAKHSQHGAPQLEHTDGVKGRLELLKFEVMVFLEIVQQASYFEAVVPTNALDSHNKPTVILTTTTYTEMQSHTSRTQTRLECYVHTMSVRTHCAVLIS